jgi:uncharacterized protein (DUF1501 family)
METGALGRFGHGDGWLARAVGSLPPERSPFRAVALSPTLPRALRGSIGALAIQSVRDFDVRGAGQAVASRGLEALYEQDVRDLLHGTGRESFEAVKMLKSAQLANVPPANGAAYPTGGFANAMRQVAQLIRGNLGLEVAFVDVGGWDTHVGQGNEQGQLAARLTEFGGALSAFARDLGDRLADVVILTMSEFGRTVRENGNRGTDHGHGTVMFVLGGAVRGGQIYGRWPGLAPHQLYEGRDLALTTDFRALFTEVATRHLGVPTSAALFPGWRPTGTPLGLFA